MATERREFANEIEAREFVWDRAMFAMRMVTGSVLGPAANDPRKVFVVWVSEREDLR